MTEKLRFYARGTACVPDPHGADAIPQRRRMVGRVHKEVSPGTWAWVPTEKADELAYHHDLSKAVKDGDLWPADEPTAKALGVQFDAKFGGEIVENKAPKGSDKPAQSGGKGDV